MLQIISSLSFFRCSVNCFSCSVHFVHRQVFFKVLVLDLLKLSRSDSSCLELLLEPALLEMLADYDEDALSLLVLLPRHVRGTRGKHAHTVEDELLVRALDGQETLHSVDIGSFLLQDLS